MISQKRIHSKVAIDEPMQILMERLSSKSSDLYIFWQNYNQLYHQYNEKIVQIQRLQQENDHLKRQRHLVKGNNPGQQQSFFKERFLYMEKSCQDFKQQAQKIRMSNRDLKNDNQKYHDENNQLKGLLQQLRQQNATQKSNIQKILNQLRIAQNQINSMTKVYDDLGQKDLIINKFINNQREYIDKINELEGQIDDINAEHRNFKLQSERLLKQSMANVKNKIMETLPGLVHTSKNRIQIVPPSK